MIHVLYVEDDPVVAALVRASFKLAGPAFALEIETTGRAGLDRMKNGGVDILLLDLELPDTNGLRVLGELSARGDPTPVIMVSGHGQTELAVKALRAGAVDCVDKASPQFLQIADAARRAHERRSAEGDAGAAAPERPEKHRVWLVEQSAETGAALASFLAATAPQFDLTVLTAAAEVQARLQADVTADAVLIGAPPAGLDAFDLLRSLRSQRADLPVILLAARNDAEAAVAAFKLGARDYILRTDDYRAQVVFSLSQSLHRAALARHNAHLRRELTDLNRSLEAQVEARTSELHALSLRLLRVQEEERRHLARELHDQIGQTLTGLQLHLEALRAQTEPAMAGRLAEAVALVQDLLGRARALTLELRPPLLDDLGLKAALEWHLQLFQRQTGIAVALDYALGPERLPGELETTIFRVAQEALRNVARHSGAKAAELALLEGADELILEVSDRGCGFDSKRSRPRPDALGLASMAERVQLAGGRLEVSSQVGQGTRLHATFRRPSPSRAA